MKNKICCILPVFLVLSLAAAASAWVETYGTAGDENGFDVLLKPDGEYLAVGSIKAVAGIDTNLYYLTAFPSGFSFFNNTVGLPTYNEVPRCVTYTSDPGFLICGTSTSPGTGYSYLYLVKLNGLNNYVWAKTLGPDGHSAGNSVIESTAGGYAVAGSTDAFGAGMKDAYLMKTDADGNCVWARTYGWNSEDQAMSVMQSSDGGYILAGDSSSDFWIIKVDADGDCVWSRTYGGPAGERCFAACKTTDGGYILAGDTYSFGAGGRDVYLVKTDSDGNCVWARTYGGFDADSVRSIQPAPDGGYVMCGSSSSIGAGPNNIYTLKVDAAGVLEWEDAYYGGLYDYGYSCRAVSDGYIFIGAVSLTGYMSKGGVDIMMIKTDAYGNPYSVPTITVTRTTTSTPTVTPTPTAMGYSWGGTGLWHEITDANADTWTGAARPFTSSSTNTWWYGQDATGDYDTGSWNRGELTSPFFSVGTGQALFFWSWEQTEKFYSPDYYDLRFVYVSADNGATWTKVRQCYGVEDQWYEPFVDLSAYSGQNVIFKFVFDTDYSSIANDYRGWFVDDIRLGTAPSPTPTRTNTPVCSPTSTSTYIPESDWQLADTPGFSPRAGHASAVFDGKMWVIGGNAGNSIFKDVWYTQNGVDWVMATGNAAFGGRALHECVIYDNKMWVIGGQTDVSGTIKNDVWYSVNGSDWLQATGNAGFTPRTIFSLLEYDGKMWVIGGSSSSGNMTDVWNSTDGINWTQVTAGAAFLDRGGFSGTVFDGKMWITGGYKGSPLSVDYNDAWYSTDGINWVMAVEHAAFPPRSVHETFVHDGRMWLIGGADVYIAGIRRNDVWYTYDGAIWYQATSGADFSPRFLHECVSFLGKMWVIGGKYAYGQEYNDAWYSPPGLLPGTTATQTHTVTPVCSPTVTCTITQTPTYTVEQDWVLAAASAAFPGRSNLSAVVYDCRMWVIGGVNGSTYYGDVWYSADGSSWYQAAGAAAFGPRYGQSSLEFGGSMWVIGGRRDTGAYQRDAWRSTDGIDWQAVTQNAGFIGRAGHASVVFDGKMWVIGGLNGSYLADVWYSTDGAVWTLAVSNAAFGGRALHSAVVYDGKIWVIGGINGTDLNDVWYSNDGISWFLATGAAGFGGRRGHSSLVYNGRMWVIAGQSASYYNDVWWSNDGISWDYAVLNADFSDRARHASVVFRDKMWVIGGTAGNREVWYSPPGTLPPCGTPTVTPTATFTSEVTATVTVTASQTATEVLTPVFTQTPVASPVYTETPSPTATLTITPQQSATHTVTDTVVPVFTQTFTVTATRTPVPEQEKLYFTEGPVLYPNPSLNGTFRIRYNASQAADFSMKIYTAGFRKICEIKRAGIAPGPAVVSALDSETGRMAGGLYYYIVTLRGAGGAISAPPSHLIIIR